ncbi:unnamed protein product, partial [Laminaria digitata]
MGGRYGVPESGVCESGYLRRDEPWLIPGFLGDATQDPQNGLFYQGWCEDFRLPAYESNLGDITAEEIVTNTSFARANPIPNGNVIPRKMELLDGAMIDQSKLFILFRESYPSFIGGEDLVAYGYLIMERKPVDIDAELDSDGDGVPDPYDGEVSPEMPTQVDIDGLSCSDTILSEIGMPAANLSNATDRAAVIDRLINGRDTSAGTNSISLPGSGCTSGSAEIVHYVCHETGLFNGGRDNTACWGEGDRGPNTDSCSLRRNGVCNDGGPGSATAGCPIGSDVTDCGYRYDDPREACPLTSDVTYFTAPASQTSAIRTHPCQNSGTCLSQLEQWVNSGAVVVQLDPIWTCTD